MRLRLIVALVIVIAGVAAVGAVRFLNGRPALIATSVPTSLASNLPSAAPTATALSVSESTAMPAPGPTPVPPATSDPNLLTMTNGSFVRRWTVGSFAASPQELAQNNSLGILPAVMRPAELLFEMPSVAHIERIGVTLRAERDAQVDVAVGTDARALRPVGTIRYTTVAAEKELALDVGSDARFARFVIHHAPGAPLVIQRIAGYGTAGAPRRGALSGTWVSADSIASKADDGAFAGVRGSVPDKPPPGADGDPLVTIASENGLATFECRYRKPTWHGTLTDGTARRGGDRLQLAGDGNLLVGYAEPHFILALRGKSARCATTVAGKGPTVATFVRVANEPAPEIDPAFMPGYRFEQHLLPLLDAAQLQRAQFAVIDGDCDVSSDLTSQQQRTLLDWVAAGHKLIIRDADVCDSSDYSFLPYRFATVANGRGGNRGGLLAIADPSTLGSGPTDPPHFIDTDAYLKHPSQQIGDADIMQTADARWCGHLFSNNAAGATGWVHAYARHGRGLIIYDGFDRDDINVRIPAALRVVALEYAQPVQAELPCNARVASLLVLFPSAGRTLASGKAVDLRIPMTLAYAAKSVPAQDVAISIGGYVHDRASVSPLHVRLKPGERIPVVSTIRLAAGWNGSHAYTVTASGATGQIAQATIRIDASLALAKAFESQRRVRIYGIHFDVDSARIQPQSEETIGEIAQVLALHPDWRMRVEGHTDADGGAAYNNNLSVRRADAVVADLVARFRVTRSRLTAAGFGLTRPVASNATEAGKALNRRVELVRL